MKVELERLRATEADRMRDRVDARLDTLYSDAAPALAQVVMQKHLLGTQAAQLGVMDVLSVGMRLVTAFRNAGLVVSDDVGQEVPFDPAHHAPAHAGASIGPGQTVIVRMPEVRTATDRVLSRALVQRVGE
jgi:hypothetical protein